MKPTTKHKLDYCNQCGAMVRCATCDNNSCNGGYGSVDGRPGMGTVDNHCPDCPDAYAVQDAFNKDPKSVSFDHGSNEELLALLARVQGHGGDALPWLTEALKRGLEVPPGRYWINDSLDEADRRQVRAKRAQEET